MARDRPELPEDEFLCVSQGSPLEGTGLARSAFLRRCTQENTAASEHDEQPAAAQRGAPEEVAPRRIPHDDLLEEDREQQRGDVGVNDWFATSNEIHDQSWPCRGRSRSG